MPEFKIYPANPSNAPPYDTFEAQVQTGSIFNSYADYYFFEVILLFKNLLFKS